MQINGIAASFTNYGQYHNTNNPLNTDVNTAAVSGTASGIGQSANTTDLSGTDTTDPSVKPGYKTSPAECETCKERKYQDGSDENVSFKSASHISPQASASRVMSHEQEHVSNAYTNAAQKGGEVVSCSVSLHTSVCPECGRSYVSGGETTTMIKYPNESNPYQKSLKSADATVLAGANLDLTA